MNTIKDNKWKKVWNSRICDVPPSIDQSNLLDELIKIDGFDGNISHISMHDWDVYVNSIIDIGNIKQSDKIFEIGCGSGAFLYPLYINGFEVAGIDYSEGLVKEAQKHLKGCNLKVCEAINIDSNERYDIVLSNSTFSYFPSYEYASQVLTKMFKKANKSIIILDIPNLKFIESSEANRKRQILNYVNLYKDMEHLYYSKKWFLEFAEREMCRVTFFDQNIPGYGNSPFRFNCVIKKTT